MADKREGKPGEQTETGGRTGIFSVGIDRSGMGEVIQVLDGQVLIWSYARHIDPGPGDAPEPVVRGLINEIDRLRRIQTDQVLTTERVKDATDFTLAMAFNGFAREEGYVSPDLHEERERLAGQFGKDNVLSSFFIDDQGTTQLGLFVRHIET